MPIYDYTCAACGHHFELMHGVFADRPTICPECGSGPLRKGINAPAIHFKGSGWAKKERRATAAPGSAKASADDGAAGDRPKSGAESTDNGPTDKAATGETSTGSSDASTSKDRPSTRDGASAAVKDAPAKGSSTATGSSGSSSSSSPSSGGD